MALLHSFEFGQAIDAFKTVVEKDPSCGIALWATGAGAVGQPVLGRAPAGAAAGGRTRRRIERAAAAGAKTPRERGFIAAAAALYDKFETVDQRTRLRAYRDAMGRLAGQYPRRSGSVGLLRPRASRRRPIRPTRPTSIS